MLLYKKIILLLVSLLFLTGCADTGFGDNLFGLGNQERGAGLSLENYNLNGPKRGVTVNFQNGKPANPIPGEFFVGLDIANYMDEQVSVSFDVWDTSPRIGFNDKTEIPLVLKKAYYQRDNGGKMKFFGPYVEKYNMGPSFLSEGVKAGESTQFLTKIEYYIKGDIEVNFCVTNPDEEKEMSCAQSETLSGAKLGDRNARYPVYVESIKKSFYGGGEGRVLLTLDIKISNGGMGKVVSRFSNSEDSYVEFNIIGLSSSNLFSCRSDDNVNKLGKYDVNIASLPMTLDMEEKSSIIVTCTTSLDVYEPLQDVRIKILTDYGYEYLSSTGNIEVKGGV